jgi:uncharacterized short protein YbdD (DUF466 family)
MRVRRTGGQAGRRAVAPVQGADRCSDQPSVCPSARLSALAALLRHLFGMPDYDAYIAHLRAHHPDRPVPTEREFYDEYVRTRYADGPTRCC